MFPAGPATPRGVASRDLLAAVVDRLAEAGWRPATVDVTIVAARPRLADHLDAMRATVADGPEGAGRSISSLALATIEKAP